MSDTKQPEPEPTRRHRPVKGPLEEGSRQGPTPAQRIPSVQASEQPTLRTPRMDANAQMPPASHVRPAGLPEAPPEGGSLSIPWWGFVLVIMTVAAITCGMWWMVLSNRGDVSTSLSPSPPAVFVVITATPTLSTGGNENTSAEVTEGPPPTAVPTAEATSTPPPVGEGLDIGVRITVQGTEGLGLAVRQGPGVDFTYFFVGNDGDIFVIEDGPREADGYVWWFIQDPNNADRQGWAAASWLQLAP